MYVFLKYLVALQVFSYYNNDTNVYEYAVNKHACPTDITLHSVATVYEVQ